MQTPISLKSTERKAYQTSFADGLWDVFIGCFMLLFALAPFLSEFLGDFWSSVIFLPFWGLVYLVIWLVRKYVVTPRIGTVAFGKTRQRKLRTFNRVMIIINALVLALGILVFFLARGIRLEVIPFLFGAIMLMFCSIAAYLLDFSRLYAYGLMLFAAPLVGEWLYASYGTSHHGYPIVFGFSSGIMILTGLVIFTRFVLVNPVHSYERA